MRRRVCPLLIQLAALHHGRSPHLLCPGVPGKESKTDKMKEDAILSLTMFLSEIDIPAQRQRQGLSGGVSGLSLTELSRRLKRDVSSLSAVAERVLSRSREDSYLEKKKQLLERALF